MRTANVARTADRRRHIQEAALVCFQRSGFRDASIADICAQAGIGPSTLYHYFDSKEAIIEAVADEDLARAGQVIGRLLRSGSMLENLLQALEDPKINQAFGASDALWLEISAEASRNPRIALLRRQFDVSVRAQIADMLQAGQARGEFNLGFDPSDGAIILLSLIEGLMMRRDADHPDELTRATRLAADLVKTFLKP